MMHRFCERDDGRGALQVDHLDEHLGWLRRHDFNLVSLAWIEAAVRSGTPIPPKTVALTVDDGYDDFVRLAYPLFEKHDCPVTVFLTTGFLDNRSWLWWDRIEYALGEATRTTCEIVLGSQPQHFSWNTVPERHAVARRIAALLKWMPAHSREDHLLELQRQLRVHPPLEVTPAFAPLTWEDVRSLEGRLVSFGPHSVSHPLLSMESDAASADEISSSWLRLRAETSSPLATFCFPNGDLRSFGPRELQVLQQVGLTCAVSTVGDYLSIERDRPEDPADVLLFPRLQVESLHDRFAQVVSGVDRLKWIVTGRRPARA